ncbi:MAG: glucose-6-phosphate dehydrogenase assembly protein OpcA, partial [Acidobacteriota bacterium]|nr:glucose-6-phosphate dehydrogenase assembly protein OpcA [Acidobacteriota bacterium]
AFVDRPYSGEVANRLRGVGRYHASRLIVLAYEPRRTQLDARVTVAAEHEPQPGELALLHETVLVELGDSHMDDLHSIVDPLVLTDVPTLLWSPHGHPEAVAALAPLAQTVLLDTAVDPVWRDALNNACELTRRLYVVDLAWVRSSPWRERIAAAFAREPRRSELDLIAGIAIRHHPDFTVSAMLLTGWLASRLDWQISPLVVHSGAHREVTGSAHGRRQDVEIRLRAEPDQQVPGLAGITIETARGRTLRLDRGPGGLHAQERRPKGDTHRWVILGASRGEGGILGEGIRQALLRDPTYAPALSAARAMIS